jgi:SAM-dependent methyltransferase
MADPLAASFAWAQGIAMSDELVFTGERFVPGSAGEIWYEHWHRYHFVAPMVAGREVLDIACGEGYGSALLARHATRVTGADIAPAAIAHARSRYADRSNLAFQEADCAALPFADSSFDVVVSFETIEHLAAQEAFLDEIRRVLRPGGFVVLSCPNKIEYTDKRGYTNEFHVRELYRAELAALVAPRFPQSAWYGQRPGFFSVVWPEQGPAQAEIFEVSEASAADPSSGHTRPLYFIVVAGRGPETLTAAPTRLSVLGDRDEWVYRDYANVTRAFASMQKDDAALRKELEAAREDAIRARNTPDSATTAAVTQCAALSAEVAAQRAEISRRASFSWWLRLPLRRLVNAIKGIDPAH